MDIVVTFTPGLVDSAIQQLIIKYFALLEPIYTERQCQCSVNAVMTLATQLTLKKKWSRSKMGFYPILKRYIVFNESSMLE